MALERTHTITLSIDSTSLNVKDTTPLADYIANIGGVTDETSLLSAITGVSLELVDDSSSTIITADITALKSLIRSVTGADVDISTYFSEDSLVDDKYDVTLTFTISAADYDSTSSQIFYSSITNSVAKGIMSANWKDALDYRSRSSSSKYAIQVKSWYDQMVIANNNGLVDEALSILDSLKKIL